MSRYLIERIAEQPLITVRTRCAVRRLAGDAHLEQVVVEELASGREQSITASALFVLIGAEPHTQWLPEAIDRDHDGFILTGQDAGSAGPAASAWRILQRNAFLLETSLPGVFAAGDVRSRSVKRVAAAAGEGSMAMRFVGEHLARGAELATAGSPR
jgi:thioredoxin reductase (NADPH)